MLETKEHDKTSGTELPETQLNNLPNKQFKVTVVKMLTWEKTDLRKKWKNLVRTFTKRWKTEPIGNKGYISVK